MKNQLLQKAREYELNSDKKIITPQRPHIHLSCRVGWMNDPNGFSFYDGKYHLFYQYYPYDTKWGPMHWGHAVSEDLLHWEYLPVAIAPEEAYDKDGCYSGSATTTADGKHLLIYTSVKKNVLPNGDIDEYQTQSVAIGDGTDYVKYENNPVITADMLPEGSSHSDFRDPKIWKYEKNSSYKAVGVECPDKEYSYACVTVNRAQDGCGQIVLFTSEDGLKWEYKNVLTASENRLGRMWECPDFFELDGQWVILLSPQEMYAVGLEYQNGNNTMCMIGEFDAQRCKFTSNYDQSIDYGVDFYATQTILTADGRRIMIGWMQNWESCQVRIDGCDWFSQMTLPRELSIKNGRLYQTPIRELEQIRSQKVEYKNILFKDELTLRGVSGRHIDMEIVLKPCRKLIENNEMSENKAFDDKQDEMSANKVFDDKQGDTSENKVFDDKQVDTSAEMFKKFEIRFAQDEQFYTSLSFRTSDSVLTLDRKYSGTRRAGIHERSCRVDWNNELKLRIILDLYSAEVFVNDGAQVMTITMYTPEVADGITFISDGAAVIDVVKYDLV